MSPITPQQFLAQHSEFAPDERLEKLVEVLRGPNGCPWDQRQTASTMIDFVIDEAHELKEALQQSDLSEVIGELGDLTFTFTFLRQILAERLSSESASKALVEKMITRHPHVFAKGDTDTTTPESEIKRRWESLKSVEKPSQENRRLDRDLPASLPAWKKAAKVLTRARNAGFHYTTSAAAWDKVSEEWGELCQALDEGSPQQKESELGDVLLALATAAIEEGIDAESALLGSVRKLSDRIEKLEGLAGKALSEIPRADLPSLYAQARGETGRAYLNYCGVSPWPGPVRRAVAQAATKLGRDGLSAALDLRLQREGLRDQLRAFVAAESATDVVFVPNVSAACFGVGHSLDWQKGDGILLGRQEFPANTVPWRLAADAFDLRITEFDDDRFRREPETAWGDLEQILQRERPRLVAFSAVSYWSGFRLDSQRLAELCHRHGAWLFVDAVQALGTMPYSMGSIDFLAGGSHKGMLSPENAGFLLVSSQVKSHWVPRVGSWLSLPDPVDFLVEGSPERNPNNKSLRTGDPTVLEGGSPNTLGYAALAASVEYLSQNDPAKIFSRVQKLHDLLEGPLEKLGFQSLRSRATDGRSALLCFDPPPGCDLVKLSSTLSERGIQAGIPRGRLRFGLHVLSSEADVGRLLTVLPDALKANFIKG